MAFSRRLAGLLLGMASAMAIASAARAADAVVEQAVIVEPDFTWTGLYVGVNAGYSWGDFEQTATIPPFGVVPILSFDGFSGTYDADADGASGGAQAGFNWQINGLIVGFEADIQAANIEGGATGSEVLVVNTILGPVDLETTVATTTEVEWFGTARLRAGFAPTQRLLVYGTGGFAFGRTNSTSSVTAVIDPSGSPETILDNETASSSDTRTGWAAGAGAEFAIDSNWSVKGEYLYTDLGDEEIFSFEEDGFSAGLSSDVKFHTVRIGVNYRF
jgi:outer membrane immunogenic protein